jgi:hypothetical protein
VRGDKARGDKERKNARGDKARGDKARENVRGDKARGDKEKGNERGDMAMRTKAYLTRIKQTLSHKKTPLFRGVFFMLC